jgi:hypothetical protein
MMLRCVLPLLCLLTLLGACSAQQAYGGLQARERNLCAEGPPQQYEECMERAGMSYEEYRRQTET